MKTTLISPQVKVSVDKDPIPTTFDKWSKPGHFSTTLAKGGKVTTTWIWNLHADVHDFDVQTASLEEISRKIFSAHFGQLAIIVLWISGMFFHGARFSNYSAWLNTPTSVLPSAHIVWPVVGQEILNGDVGGGVYGIRITSGFFGLWRAAGIVNEDELYWTSIGGLLLSGTLIFAGWLHYHKFAPKIEWFQNAESMLNHHLSGLLGLGCLSWSGHQIHVSLPINYALDEGISPADIPLPHQFLFDQELMGQFYPSFKNGLIPFFSLNWANYSDFLTFKGGLNPLTGSLWLSDVAHHHLALSVLFIISGHMYRTNWGIGHRIQDILKSHKGPLTGNGHDGLYEILTNSWHAQLAINLAMLGSISIIVAHHMYAMPPYPYLSIDYLTTLFLFTHHQWIGGFLICGAGAHASLFMVRDYYPIWAYDNLLDRVLKHRDTIISHLNWVCIFLGCHSFGLYIHNDVMFALGRWGDAFSDGAIRLQPIFAQCIQLLHASAPRVTAPNVLFGISSYVFGGGSLLVNGQVAMGPIALGTNDFMIHHIHAFNIHVSTLILLKGVLFARNSSLIPDKAEMGFRFPCDGPGRGGTCQISPWDHVFLALFWMYNTISIVIFHFSWELFSCVWGELSSDGNTILPFEFLGNFGEYSSSVGGWLGVYLWLGAGSVVGSYASSGAAAGLIFLAAHFTWAFSLMFLFSGRGYWQELIESILWAHNKLNFAPAIQPRALSITQGRAVGLAHFLLGGIGVTWAFFLSFGGEAGV
jgi:photosystem I P700 chlorophyll a apoprotein A1